MFRTFVLATALALSAVPAMAEDDPRNDPRIAEALAELPTKAEIDDMMADMPNITGLMQGMMDIATDENNHAALERIAGRLEEKVEGLDFEADLEAGKVPDVNGLMEEVMYLTTDREMMTDVFSLWFQFQDVMEEVAPEGETDLLE